ncbi:hypothetical protein O181_014974 [Austropuccinia psidii MF-1]|uniref:Uncharacterized protein n=1 Tax=Austropuccinia psidii MF-1 TaxID=1389203 RepID=A0A9Q3BZ47_9BASI|nr:hypothetical protein [Austropuccinia psidii MF-1]
MHNWFEGVLQHHFWRCWKFGMSPIEQESDVNLHDSEEEAKSMDYEIHETWSFKSKEEEHIKRAISDVKFLAGIMKVPFAIGESKTGKLKASEWHSLFSLYLPLAIMDIPSVTSYGLGQNEGSKAKLLLDNL